MTAPTEPVEPLVVGAGALAAGGAGFHFEERVPPPPLGDTVARLWRSRVAGPSDHRLRVVPDGCVELSRSDEGELLVFGPTATSTVLTLGAGRRFDGARLRAGAARALLGVDVDELRGLVVPAGEVAGVGVLVGRGPEEWAVTLLRWAEERRWAYRGDVVAVRAPGMLAQVPGRPVPEIARLLGVSERQFLRRFRQAVGLPPATWRRVVRARQAMSAAAAQPERSLTSLAHDHGFADQAHLTRTVRDIAGLAPRDLLGR